MFVLATPIWRRPDHVGQMRVFYKGDFALVIFPDWLYPEFERYFRIADDTLMSGRDVLKFVGIMKGGKINRKVARDPKSRWIIQTVDHKYFKRGK